MSKLNQSASSFSRFIKSSSLKMLLAPLGAVALLGMGSNFWLSGQVNAQTTRNRPAQTNARSNIARLNLTLNLQPNESYDTFIRRADAAARNTAIRSFNQNRSLRGVAVTVLGQNAGNIVPILSLEVSRQNWVNRPDTQRWATYFKNAPTLLGLNTPNTNLANQPANSTGSAVVVPGRVVNSQTNSANGTSTVNGQGFTVNGSSINNGSTTNGQGLAGNDVNNVPTTSGQGLSGNNLNNVPTTSGQGFPDNNLNNVPTTTGQGFNNTFNNAPNDTTNGQGFGSNDFGNTTGTNNGQGFGSNDFGNTTNTNNGQGFGSNGFGNTTNTNNGTGFGGNAGGTGATGTGGF